MLLSNNVFNFVLLRNIHYLRETGTPVTPTGQQNNYPYRKSTISCCSGMMYIFDPQIGQFCAVRESTNIVLCCSLNKIKYFVLLGKWYGARMGGSKNS
jgi:hypothetical protein